MNEKRDPELAEDLDVHEEEVEACEMPDYDPEQFELPDDYEYVDEEGEDDGSDE